MFRVLLLRLIHYVIALGEFACGIFRSYPQYKSIFGKKQHASKVETDAKKLSKLPLHIGLLVVENQISLTDLANMIIWSVTMGISHVSVYDINGELKRSSRGLQEAVDQSKKDMSFGEGQFPGIQIFNHSRLYTEQLAVGRGSKKAEVHLLSAEDGCQSVVQVARNLSRQVASQENFVSKICPAFVTDAIHETHPFPDPDLIMKFGATQSLMGYLPWQTRLTEIVSIPSHKGMTYQGFYSSLQTYANTQQRFGK